MSKCWMNTVSRDHALGGVAGGFTQADHGRSTRLRRLSPGDELAFYSPRTQLRGGEPLQQLTAYGVVTGEEVYQVEMGPDFHPWRLAVRFAEVTPADIRPLVARFSFVTDEKRWGLPFRRGLFEIPADDMALVREALGVA